MLLISNFPDFYGIELAEHRTPPLELKIFYGKVQKIEEAFLKNRPDLVKKEKTKVVKHAKGLIDNVAQKMRRDISKNSVEKVIQKSFKPLVERI